MKIIFDWFLIEQCNDREIFSSRDIKVYGDDEDNDDEDKDSHLCEPDVD